MVAVLVEHHGRAAEHRRPFAGEAAESLAFEKQLLTPDILYNDLLGERSAVPRQLVGADDLGDDEICIERNEELGAVVVEEAVGAAARGGDSIDWVKDVERRTLEYRRRLKEPPGRLLSRIPRLMKQSSISAR